jgi:hypothetical protein
MPFQRMLHDLRPGLCIAQPVTNKCFPHNGLAIKDDPVPEKLAYMR